MKDNIPIIPNKSRNNKILALSLGVLAVVGAWLATSGAGPGLDPDAASYLSAAESFAHGDGLSVPTADWEAEQPTSALAHFPPGYPVAIATAMTLGAEPPQAARAVDAVAAGVSVSASVFLVASVVGLAPAAVAGAAIFVARPLVLVHISVLSEPLFLALMALTLLAMVRRAPPWATGTVAAFAALVRYAGVSVVAAAVLWELVSPGEHKRRFLRAAIAALPAVVLQGGWTLYVSAESGPSSIRELGIYHGFASTLAQGGRTIAAWLAPTSEPPGAVRLVAGAVAAFALIAVVWLGARRTLRERRSARVALGACALLLLCYAGVVVASRLVADAGIPFDERIFAPIVLLVTVGTAVAVAAGWSRWGLLLRWGIVAGASAWIGLSAAASLDEVTWSVTEGSDFAGTPWRDSELLKWTQENARELKLYSNWPAALYFYDHRASWSLPESADRTTLKAFVDTLAARHALVVAFDTQSPDGVSPDSIARLVGLRVLIRLRDGAIYRPPYTENEIIEP